MIRTSSPRALSLILMWASFHAAGKMRRPECPEGFVVAWVNGVLASVGVARICEEACDGECCVSLGMCDGFTVVWLSRDSTSCPGEGAYGDASIDGVFWGARALRRATTPQGRGWAIGEVIQGCFGERVCSVGPTICLRRRRPVGNEKGNITCGKDEQGEGVKRNNNMRKLRS